MINELLVAMTLVALACVLGLGLLLFALEGRLRAVEAAVFPDDDSAPVADAPTDVPSDQFPVLDPYRDYPTLPAGTHTGEM